jgi:hypothetical protein
MLELPDLAIGGGSPLHPFDHRMVRPALDHFHTRGWRRGFGKRRLLGPGITARPQEAAKAATEGQ